MLPRKIGFVWDLDETSCRVLSASEYGWVATGGGQALCPRDLSSFGGLDVPLRRRARGLPSSCLRAWAGHRNGRAVPTPVHLLSHAVSLDVHTQTLLDVLTLRREHINEEHRQDEPWILVLNLASTQQSA